MHITWQIVKPCRNWKYTELDGNMTDVVPPGGSMGHVFKGSTFILHLSNKQVLHVGTKWHNICHIEYIKSIVICLHTNKPGNYV